MGKLNFLENGGMSNLIVRVGNRDIAPVDCTINIKQSEIGDISCTVANESLVQGTSESVARRALKFQDIAIYSDGTLLRSGYIKDVTPAMVGKAQGFFRITAEDEIGRLRLIWSKPDAHYQDVELLDIIADLLTLASEWELGDTSTMADPAVTTTVNLRTKERLWPQILDACKTVPQVFLRYGGFNTITNNHKLDVGLFNEASEARYAYQGENIMGSPKLKRSPIEMIRRLRPVGGKAGSSVVVLNGAEIDLPEFPITLDVPTGEYYIENTLVSTGVDTVKTYNEIRTANATPPTNNQLNKARQALYNAGVRELQGLMTQSDAEREILNLDCTLPALPQIGQLIKVRSKAYTPVMDALSGMRYFRNLEDVDGNYRITQISMQYKSDTPQLAVARHLKQSIQKGFMVSLECTNGLELADYDESNYLAKKFERHEDGEPFGAGIGLGGSYLISVSHGTGVASDCTSAGTAGKLFQFDFDPPISPAIRAVSWELISKTGTNTYTIVQAPTLLLPLILCVTDNGGGAWTISDSATIVIQYTYYT